MENVMTTTITPEFSKLFTWWTIIWVNMVMLMIAYWLADIAFMMNKRGRKVSALLLAVAGFAIGIWRMIAVLIYYENIAAMLTIPVTANLTWLIIGIIGYSAHRYIKGIYQRNLVSKKNLELSIAVEKEIVEPLLRGEPVSKELIAEHKAASYAFQNSAK